LKLAIKDNRPSQLFVDYYEDDLTKESDYKKLEIQLRE
jgi:hypothetical protein